MTERLVWRCEQGRSRNFYTLSIERDLWGTRAIVRRWGRLDGTRIGVIVDWDPHLDIAQLVKTVHERRIAHDYELIQSSPE